MKMALVLGCEIADDEGDGCVFHKIALLEGQ